MNIAARIIRQANALHPQYDRKWQGIFAAAECGEPIY